jgi:hypothetical protein
MGRIRITENYRHPDGWHFWKGEVLDIVGGPELDILTGEETVEVKTRGEYVAIPATHCERMP